MDKLVKYNYIKEKIKLLGLTLVEFAEMINLKSNGERTVGGWERGEHEPSSARWDQIVQLQTHVPFKPSKRKIPKFNFIDLFAGIGGMRIAFEGAGGECVFSSEWDKDSQKTYQANFGELPHGDITKIKARDIPDFDVLLAGFPCQPFSSIGQRAGFTTCRLIRVGVNQNSN